MVRCKLNLAASKTAFGLCSDGRPRNKDGQDGRKRTRREISIQQRAGPCLEASHSMATRRVSNAKAVLACSALFLLIGCALLNELRESNDRRFSFLRDAEIVERRVSSDGLQGGTSSTTYRVNKAYSLVVLEAVKELKGLGYRLRLKRANYNILNRSDGWQVVVAASEADASSQGTKRSAEASSTFINVDKPEPQGPITALRAAFSR